MAPQPLASKVDRLEERVTNLEALPSRVDALTVQISLHRTETRAEFSAVRSEMADMRETLLEQIDNLRRETLAAIEQLATHMRVLHEDVIGRIALLGEGRPRPIRKRSK